MVFLAARRQTDRGTFTDKAPLERSFVGEPHRHPIEALAGKIDRGRRFEGNALEFEIHKLVVLVETITVEVE